MTPYNEMRKLTKAAKRGCTQRGFGMVSAIFLLVVLAGLAVAMVTFSTAQQSSSALDVQGARAYQAARAGIEWGLYQRFIIKTACTAAGTTNSFQLPAGESLSAFTATVVCKQTAAIPTAAADRYQLTSTACNQPAAVEPKCPNPSTNLDYIQRVVQVEF